MHRLKRDCTPAEVIVIVSAITVILFVTSLLGPVDIQPSVTKLVHFPPPEAKFSSNRSTIPQKIPLQEEK
ncbi:MAG: hypothetical protein WC314_05630, partial [Vulcanimicrobiota bacterium]